MASSRTLFQRRRHRVRNQLAKKSRDRVRLSIHRSSRHIYAQIIDDGKGKTLAAASTVEKELRSKSGGNCDGAASVGKLIAERAGKAGISEVVFDRGGFLFHGRVKALADAAREGGLKF